LNPVKDKIKSLPVESFPLKAKWRSGLDNSGGQQTPHQKSQNELAQKNREVVVTCLDAILDTNGSILYDNEYKNSDCGMRPLMIVPGEFHDQGDAKWVVIRGQLRGHNDMPFGRPIPQPAYWFQLMFISSSIF
jgi:hypothetical protein